MPDDPNEENASNDEFGAGGNGARRDPDLGANAAPIRDQLDFLTSRVDQMANMFSQLMATLASNDMGPVPNVTGWPPSNRNPAVPGRNGN